MTKAGLTDPKSDAMKYMARLSFPTLYDPTSPKLGIPDFEYSLIETYYDTASVAIDALGAIGVPSIPDWTMDSSGVLGGRISYHALLPEEKAPFGRHLVSVAGQGGSGGAGLIKEFKAVLDKYKVPVLLEHRVTRLFRNSSGQVVGVEATHGNSAVVVRAQKAIVFGSGGFTHNPYMRINYLRGPIFGGCEVPTNTGDFINIAGEAGAALGNLNNAWWGENAFEQTTQNTSVPSDVFILGGDSMMVVNKHGRRVVNEKSEYPDRTQAHFYWDPTRAEYPNLLLFMLYDDHVAKTGVAGDPIPKPGVDSPLVVAGATWEQLAKNLDMRLAKYAGVTGGVRLDAEFLRNLRDTVARFNGFAAVGKDLDFGRGDTPIERGDNGSKVTAVVSDGRQVISIDDATGSARHKRPANSPNPTMYPMADSGPYYAILLGGGTLATNGGPKINSKAQVLSTSGAPIPGLYGAGNCIASPAGPAYWSGGGTLGPALTYAYMAGLNASQEPIKAV